MEKIVKVGGLNCATCGEKIETKLRDIPWIDEVNLNFSLGSLSIKVKNQESYSLPFLQKVVDNIEEGVTLLDNNESVTETKHGGLVKLLLSLTFFITGLFLHQYPTLHFVLLGVAYIISGYEVIYRAIRNILKGNFFDEFFLMSIATIGAFIIHEYAEGVGVMIFFQIGEFFQDIAVGKSKKSIQSLMSLKPEFVRLENGDIVPPESVKPETLIEVRPGEKVPLDGILYRGNTTLDTKTITGESIPRNSYQGDQLLSGFINISENIVVKTTKIFSESTVSKILEMVQNESSKKTPTEKFISRFSKVYTPIVVVTALLIALFAPVEDSLYKGLIFLVISCPCALVISVPLGYFGGIGRAGKSGILIKGSSFLDKLTSVNTFAFDKTGTLTRGEFSVTEVYISNNSSREEFLDVALKVEQKSNHPIAIAITKYCGEQEKSLPTTFKEVTGLGVMCSYGKDIFIGGKKELLEQSDIEIDVVNVDKNGTVVHFSKNSVYIGSIALNDTLKSRVPKMIEILGSEDVYMLTGDSEGSAKKIANEAGIANYNHSLLPLDKANIVKKLGKDRNVLFVGDGINDAPVLAASYIGVSMGGLGSDVAIEASDIVLMDDDPSKIIDAIKIAKFTKKVIIGNIIIALGFKGIIMILGLTGIAGLWLAIFADVGVSLIAVLNSTRTLKLKIRD